MRSKKPVIGITVSAAERSAAKRWPSRYDFDYLKRSYCLSIVLAGGIPVPLPNIPDKNTVREYINIIDGLLVSGGGDMHPRYFRQKPYPGINLSARARDEFELEVIRQASKRDLPVFGICRGLQVINIAMGGTIYQDLSFAPFDTISHADPKETGDNYHNIRIVENSLLSSIIFAGRIEVNTSHHQIIDRLGNRLIATAYSSDGVVEAFENPDSTFFLAVQWHPEKMPKRLHSKRLFEAFIRAASQK